MTNCQSSLSDAGPEDAGTACPLPDAVSVSQSSLSDAGPEDAGTACPLPDAVSVSRAAAVNFDDVHRELNQLSSQLRGINHHNSSSCAVLLPVSSCGSDLSKLIVDSCCLCNYCCTRLTTSYSEQPMTLQCTKGLLSAVSAA